MAIVQLGHPTAGQAYYRRKLAQAKSPKQALRWLNRRLSDVVDRCRSPTSNGQTRQQRPDRTPPP
jgi:hypothetical protein